MEWKDALAGTEQAGQVKNSQCVPNTDIKVPYPTIYISGNDQQAESSLQYSKLKQRPVVYRLALYSDYTEEEKENCNGKYSCMLCDRPIPKKIYFIPKSQSVTGIWGYDSAPYCRKECCFRGLLTFFPNNFSLRALFTLRYGMNVRAAPPRSMLKVKGGYTLEQFHEEIDSFHVTEEEPENIRAYMCPTFYSTCAMEGFKPMTEAVRIMDEMYIENKTVMGPAKSRDDRDLNVVSLQTKNIDQIPVSESYVMDKHSFSEDRPKNHSSFEQKKRE